VTGGDSPERIIERTDEPVFILDPATDRFLAANRAACAMLGYTSEVLLATPVSRIHRGELPQLQLVVAEVLKHGRATTDRLTCRTISGECLPVAMTLSSFELDGRLLVIGLVHDRSEHRR
jgi:PAS domain S-box-containing protein